MTRRFGREMWLSVGKDLRGVASTWWRENRDSIIDLGREEMRQVGLLLKAGDTFSAKMELAGNMSPEEWAAYRDGVTDRLQGIAAHRAAVMDALEDIGRRAARVIGAAILGALL